MELGIRRRGLLILKRGKIVRRQNIELPNEETMKEAEQGGYTYLGIVELDKIKGNEIKEKKISNQRIQKET